MKCTHPCQLLTLETHLALVSKGSAAAGWKGLDSALVVLLIKVHSQGCTGFAGLLQPLRAGAGTLASEDRAAFGGGPRGAGDESDLAASWQRGRNAELAGWEVCLVKHMKS